MNYLDDFIKYLVNNSPKTILDIGFVNGVYGALAINVLEYGRGRYNKEDWETIIYGLPDTQAVPTLFWDFYTVVDPDIDSVRLNQLGGFDLVIITKDGFTNCAIEYLKSVNKKVLELD